MTEEYFVISERDERKLHEPNHSEWPKIVAYSFNSSKIYMSEGYGHGLMGGVISLSNFDPDKWKSIFLEVGAEWFLNYLSSGAISTIKNEHEFTELLKQHGCSFKKIKY